MEFEHLAHASGQKSPSVGYRQVPSGFATPSAQPDSDSYLVTASLQA
jgi:hypothetical protein